METKSEEVESQNDEEDSDEDSDSSEIDDGEDNETEEPKSIGEKLKSIFPFKYIFGSSEIDEEDSDEDDKRYSEYVKQETEDDDTDDDNSQEDDDIPVKPVIKALPKKETQKPVQQKQPQLSKPAQKKSEKPKEKISISPDDFDSLLRNLPSFIPDYTKVDNAECRAQGLIFKRQLRGQKIWALQMMDANAKVPSGLLRGNTNQLGDFDLCTRISQKIKISDKESIKMKGKYCLANIDVIAAVEELKLPVHLMQGRNFMRSTIHDVSISTC